MKSHKKNLVIPKSAPSLNSQIQQKVFPVYFYISKTFFKKIKFFLFFSLYQIKFFLIFLNYFDFDALISKIIFKK